MIGEGIFTIEGIWTMILSPKQLAANLWAMIPHYQTATMIIIIIILWKRWIKKEPVSKILLLYIEAVYGLDHWNKEVMHFQQGIHTFRFTALLWVNDILHCTNYGNSKLRLNLSVFFYMNWQVWVICRSCLTVSLFTMVWRTSLQSKKKSARQFLNN